MTIMTVDSLDGTQSGSHPVLGECCKEAIWHVCDLNDCGLVNQSMHIFHRAYGGIKIFGNCQSDPVSVVCC
jgi:hypothetical protein